jgi:hypothetical protein
MSQYASTDSPVPSRTTHINGKSRSRGAEDVSTTAGGFSEAFTSAKSSELYAVAGAEMGLRKFT